MTIHSDLRGRMMKNLAAALLACVALLAACAGHPAGSAPGDGCALSSADSAYLAGGAVYRDCAVDREASLDRRSVQLEMQAVNPSQSVRCMSADVELVVGIDGRPEPGTGRLVRTSYPAFGEAVLRSLAAWQYAPAEKDGRPVRQIVQERQMVAVRITAVRGGQAPPTPPSPPRC